MDPYVEKKEVSTYGLDNIRPWVTEGISFPHGTDFRGKYKGYYYSAKVENGALVLKGRRFMSPSAAAFSITRNPFLDGWFFWEFKNSETTPWSSIYSLKN